jgi:hypothetical protein
MGYAACLKGLLEIVRLERGKPARSNTKAADGLFFRRSSEVLAAWPDPVLRANSYESTMAGSSSFVGSASTLAGSHNAANSTGVR